LFAQNAWATDKVLSLCEGLTPEQLAARAPGAVGTLSETMHHYVQAECGYLSRLAPELIPPDWHPALSKDLRAVRARADELAPLWSAYAATDPDASEIRRKEWWDVTHEYPAGMEIVQALSHSYGHREQACAILTTLGIEPPELQGLKWGDELGMLRRLPPAR
jgi:uncharacterized damage-inducible protein DinB